MTKEKSETNSATKPKKNKKAVLAKALQDNLQRRKSKKDKNE